MHYDELSAVLTGTTTGIRIRYTELYRILCLVLVEATADSRMDFSGPFARLTYLFSRYSVPEHLRVRLNQCRGRCRALSEQSDDMLQAALPHDVKAVAELLHAVSGERVPWQLEKLLPKTETVPCERHEEHGCRRVCVVSCDADGTSFTAIPEDDMGETVRVSCEANRMGDWSYLCPLLCEGMQLNLVNCTEGEDGVLQPEIIVLEPDYLLDISSVAACFAESGPSPYHYLLRQFRQQPATRAILLGNMAGQMLDEIVNATADTPPDYAQTASRFMRNYAMELATLTDDMRGFHEEAMQQQQNIRALLDTAAREDPNFRPHHALLEPTFFCEMLGLQGRMDLLQDDFRLLMEQKSGRREFRTEAHREPHYVQMLLYQAVLHYSHGLRNDQISSYLLYSRFADGLLKEGPAPLLLGQAMMIRNQVVWLQLRNARGATSYLDHLLPERINTRAIGGRLWEEFLYPQLLDVLRPIQQADATSHAYFHRMLAFVAREHVLTKTGAPGREASGLAALWGSSMAEKLVAGNIFAGLSVERTWSSTSDSDATDMLRLTRPAVNHDYLPNFRTGDTVILYSYAADSEPDVRRGFASRAHICEITTSHVVLQLRTPQRNQFVFQPRDGELWAVEHDAPESGFTALYRSVFSVLTASSARRQLLLGQRMPNLAGRDENCDVQFSSAPHVAAEKLRVESQKLHALPLEAKAQNEYLLLIGPPGTGKTSLGLMNILRDELSRDTDGVLLLSYTNRAVDEICSKLVDAGLDFLRISSPHTCPDAYRPYLLAEKTAHCTRISEIRQLLQEAKVVVSTTTSMSSQLSYFALRRFSLAVIDEASQILEPHLTGILCARHGETDAIGRFVMIGDHKQLPAVVQQEPSESVVSDPLLHEIGLMDCRESLFQRLLRLHATWFPDGDSPFVHRFSRQGRMHPQVADFASSHFYGGKLRPVPLEHQKAPFCLQEPADSDPLMHRLAHQRVVFLPAERPLHTESPKVNEVEADMIARAALATYRLRTANGLPFSSLETLGIIVPYRHQIAVVRKKIAHYGLPLLDDITVDTVERFQGSQRDVIIYGFTIQMPHQLDFLCAQTFEENGVLIDRRLNVALTRAREQMILVGNPELLSLNPILRDITRL